MPMSGVDLLGLSWPGCCWRGFALELKLTLLLEIAVAGCVDLLKLLIFLGGDVCFFFLLREVD